MEKINLRCQILEELQEEAKQDRYRLMQRGAWTDQRAAAFDRYWDVLETKLEDMLAEVEQMEMNE